MLTSMFGGGGGGGSSSAAVLLPLRECRPDTVKQRIIVVGMIADKSFNESSYQSVLDAALSVMRHRHMPHCMLWNLGFKSPVQDFSQRFENRVLEYGHQDILTKCNIPPLWQIVNIVYSIKARAHGAPSTPWRPPRTVASRASRPPSAAFLPACVRAKRHP